MLSQNRYHRLFPIVSILLVVFPSFVYNDQLNSYPRKYQKQARQLQTQSDSSVSSSEVSYDTKNFDDDSVPSAFNWDSPGVSIIMPIDDWGNYMIMILKQVFPKISKSFFYPRYLVHRMMK